MISDIEHKEIIYQEQGEEKLLYATKEAIQKRGSLAVGLTIGEIDRHNRADSKEVKGGIGHVIEESWYGYKINSDAEPDFYKAGVELKATGIIRNKQGRFRAKERLVLNIINYMKEVKATFETSSFWRKNKILMLFVYEYLKDRPHSEFPIVAAELFTYPTEDLIIIRDDWAKIVGKIRAGKAHEISEGDTLYLGACTKGSTAAKSMRQQPHSEILAKQRAYCLKQQYMTYVIRTHIFHEQAEERIVRDVRLLQKKSFEEYVISKLEAYKGKSVDEMVHDFGIAVINGRRPKNLESMLAFRILGIRGNKAEELEKAGVVVKTIRIGKKGKIRENMSFPAFRYRELAEETWEESTFGEYLRNTRFLFVVYKYDSDGTHLRLLGGQFWNIPYKDLEGNVKEVWEETRNIIKEGRLTVDIVNNTLQNNFPKQKNNPVSHVRPHGQTRLGSVNKLPEGTRVNIHSSDGSFAWPYEDMFLDHCFWLNNSYILSQLDERFKR